MRKLPQLRERRKSVSLSFISTSLTLSAIELSKGGNARAIIPHIRATSSHITSVLSIDSRDALREDQDELLNMRITQMCYFDIMCCFPCARQPVVPRTFWNAHVLPFLNRREPTKQPDLFLGFGCRIFPLMGEAAALTAGWFEGQVTAETFGVSRNRLLLALENEMANLPAMVCYPYPSTSTYDSNQVQNHNGCVSAARAHAIATQVFLMRTQRTGSQHVKTRAEISRKVRELCCLVYDVAPCLNAATMMLWPLFVLGSETPTGASRRTFEDHAEILLSERWFLNISSTLAVLREQVWKLSETEQENWVWHCWRMDIAVCLA